MLYRNNSPYEKHQSRFIKSLSVSLFLIVGLGLSGQTMNPLPVCKTTYNAALNINGLVTVVPQDIDMGSSEYEHLSFSAAVLDQNRFYSCDDLGQTFALELWLTSHTGNQDFCTCMVTIVDELPPTIICPLDSDIRCDQDLNNVVLQQVTLVDNCGDTESSFVIDTIIGNCGIERFDIVWTGTDGSNNSTTCTQSINRKFNAYNTDIEWPMDFSFSGECDITTIEGPTFTNDECANILVLFSDIVSSQPGSLCGVLTRTWTVFDECSYTENPLQGWWQNVQTIQFKDTTPPTILGCEASVTYSTDESCNYELNLYLDAQDQCFAPIQKYSLLIEHVESSNAELQIWEQNGSSTVILTPGNYILTWTATDACGNAETCVQTVEVVDKTGPKVENIIHGWGADAEEMVMASDIVEAYDDCQSEAIEFWIQYPSMGPGQTVRPISAIADGFVFDCENKGLSPIDIWMEDGLGNQSYTTTYVNIGDVFGQCGPCDEQDLVLTDPWYANVPGIQLTRRANTIMSTSQLNDGSNLLFVAVDEVSLEPGFQVFNVDDFQIIIDDCQE